jgi:hypothetical protein
MGDYFYQLLNIHDVNEVRHTEMHTADAIVPEPNSFDIEIAIEKQKRYKSPSIHQFREEPTNLLILFGKRKNCHSSGRNP